MISATHVAAILAALSIVIACTGSGKSPSPPGAGGGGVAEPRPNPRLANVCAETGVLDGVVKGTCPARAEGWDWDSEMAYLAALPDQSDLPACPLSEDRDLVGLDVPGWRVRVDRVITGPAGESPDHFHTAVFATRMDGPTPCALRLLWKLKQHVVQLTPGTIFRYAHRYTIRSVEDDVSITATLRSDGGDLLIGSSTSVRPEVWDKDVLPELTLALESRPLCQEAAYPTLQRLRFSLTSVSDTCTLDASTARCCRFGGHNYAVLAADALRTTKPSPGGDPIIRDAVTVLVAREGLLRQAP